MRTFFVLVFAACAAAAPVDAQTLADEVRQLRDEVAALRAEVAQLRMGPAAAPAPVQVPAAVSVDAQLELIRSQLAEHAQTKVESASRLPLRLSGSVVSTTFLNSGTPNWLDVPNVVRAGSGVDQGSFSSTLRQSRLGLEATGLTVGAWTGAGSLVFDFFGGIPGFQTGQVMGLPRLLYAFVRLDHGRGSVLVGQDDAIVAPRSPTSLSAVSFPALFRSGNLYLRVPQIRGEMRLRAGARSTVRLLGGVVAPVAGDLATEQYAFVPPELAGERSERPALQARSVFEYAVDERHSVAVAVSGHQSRPEFSARRSSWIAATDFDVQWGAVGAAGEAFTADRAGAYGAALGQQARTRGGWAELRVMPTYRWRFVVGAGADRVRRQGESWALGGNRAGFAGIRYSLTPELHIGVEYSRLGTTPVAARTVTNHHIDGVLRYDF
ncbi:MAG: hypothetical protein AB7I50_13955 [Vicinamibacterales bacterium]